MGGGKGAILQDFDTSNPSLLLTLLIHRFSRKAGNSEHPGKVIEHAGYRQSAGLRQWGFRCAPHQALPVNQTGDWPAAVVSEIPVGVSTGDAFMHTFVFSFLSVASAWRGPVEIQP